MRIHTIVRRLELLGTPEEVFTCFADARNLEAITPEPIRMGSARSSSTGCACTACPSAGRR